MPPSRSLLLLVLLLILVRCLLRGFELLLHSQFLYCPLFLLGLLVSHWGLLLGLRYVGDELYQSEDSLTLVMIVG